MYLSKLSITGFKNFGERFDVELSEGLNVLIGENRTGKTAIIDAIRLLFMEDEFGRGGISDSDFHLPFEKKGKKAAKAADFIRIDAALSSLSKTERVAFLPWTEINDEATLTLHIDNKPSKRGRYRFARWGGASKSSIFEWELLDTMNCIYLPPLRDAERKLREGKGSRLATLFKNLNEKELARAKENDEVHPLVEVVKKFNSDLAQNTGGTIETANSLIKDRLKEAIGEYLGQDTMIQFSETSFNRIVENLRVLFFPEIDADGKPDAALFRSLEQNSLGYNNLIYLATVLAELTDITSRDDYLRILLIEEPEAHLHPQLQIRLLKYLENKASEAGIQVVVTSHSPVLTSAVSIDSIKHLALVSKYRTAYTSISKCSLPDPSKNFINRWMDATKSVLFFAKGVILVEGIAEAMVVPELAKRLIKEYNSKNAGKLPATLEDQGISVVNMNGIYFKHFMQLFCNLDGCAGDSIPLRCSGITDNDPPAESMPTKSKPLDGTNHALTLKAEINKSENCRLWSNLKTFEYDLAMEGDNIDVMIDVLVKLWPAKNGTVKNELKALKETRKRGDEEKAHAALEVLKRIDDGKVGKGLFAQVLADKLEVGGTEFSVPEYIKEAVLWACGKSDK